MSPRNIALSPIHASMPRRVSEADNAALAHIIREVLTEYGCTGHGFAIHDPEVDCMYETYAQEECAYFVIEHEGSVVGGGGVAPLKGGPSGVCELQKYYLLPEFRGKGYGRMLLDECLQAARVLGYTHCYVETVEQMVEAGAMYKRAGFIAIERSMGETGHTACTRWYLKAL